MVDNIAFISVLTNLVLVFVQCMIMLKIFEENVPRKYLKLFMLTGWMSSTILVLINAYMVAFNGTLFSFLGLVLPPPMLFTTLQGIFSSIIGILIYQNKEIWESRNVVRKN